VADTIPYFAPLRGPVQENGVTLGGNENHGTHG